MIEKILLIIILYNTIDKNSIKRKINNILEFYKEYKKKENTTNEEKLLKEWEKGGVQIERIRTIKKTN